jgi:hypothetical protein
MNMKKLIENFQSNMEEKRKPQCVSGNSRHGLDGKFQSKGQGKGSWSIAKDGPHGADCKSGQGRRMKANDSVQFTKIKCGRGENGKGKSKYRCFDGKELWQEDALQDELEKDVQAYHDSRTSIEDEEFQKQLYETLFQLDEGGKRKCWSFEEFARLMNSLIAATRGDLYKQKKA